MAKRTHAEVEADVAASYSYLTNGTKSKEHKNKHSASKNVDNVASEQSKEERKELKRLKALEKEKRLHRQIFSGGTEHGAIEKADETERVVRKAEKAQKKSNKQRADPEKNTGDVDIDGYLGAEQESKQGYDQTDAVGKFVHKSEKKRLKAKKDLEHQNGVEVSRHNHFPQEIEPQDLKYLQNGRKEDVADPAATKALRRAEKKRLRAINNSKDKKHNKVSIVTDQNHSASPEQTVSLVTTISKHQFNYTEDPSLSALPQSEVDSFLSKHFITITDPSTTATLRPVISFSQLPKVTDTSAFATFKSPTPVQSAAWPFLLSGRDVIGVAETGSGKTLAFGIPCIQTIKSLPQPSKPHGTMARAVMVSPTRELAVQIHDQISALAKPAGLNSVCVYGGVPKPPQIAALRTAHIIVATPGRLNDLISEGSADLSAATYLVLDEADRMLDKGFEDEIRKIISCCPSTAMGRQTAMFTATWPPSVRDLAATFMKNPVHISIGDNQGGELRANTRIEQRVEVVDPRSKEQRLLQIIKKHQSGKNKDDRILVFCLYKKEATRVENFLRYQGLRVTAIHGDMSQENRSKSLESFKSGACPLLVATDVAARGLDIPSVKLVLNCTFPLTVEDYVHRIGRYVSSASITSRSVKFITDIAYRTGRAGKEGLAITLFTEHDKAQSGSLINVLKAAGQPVPEALLKFGTTVKKKVHEAYGAFYRDPGAEVKEATKIVFD